MSDKLFAAETVRHFYNVNPIIRSFVDLHYYLSLVNADISPEPPDEWLQALSAVVLDHWKIGESHIARHEDNLIFCEPTSMRSASTDANSDNLYELLPPEAWTREGKPNTTPLLFKSNPYARRGESVVQKHVFVLAKAQQSGQPIDMSYVTLGFGSSQATKETLQEVMDRVRMFRAKLLKALMKLWPEWQISFYPITADEVLDIAKNVGILKK